MAVTTVTVITAAQPGPAIGFEGQGMARRGALSAPSRPRAPHLIIEPAGCRGMVVGRVWGIAPDPFRAGGIVVGARSGLWSAAVGGGPEISNGNTQLVQILHT